MPASRYRRSAEECRQRAERAQTEHERTSYLEMAAAWERLARGSEAFGRRFSSQSDGVIIPFDSDDPGSTRVP